MKGAMPLRFLHGTADLGALHAVHHSRVVEDHRLCGHALALAAGDQPCRHHFLVAHLQRHSWKFTCHKIIDHVCCHRCVPAEMVKHDTALSEVLQGSDRCLCSKSGSAPDTFRSGWLWKEVRRAFLSGDASPLGLALASAAAPSWNPCDACRQKGHLSLPSAKVPQDGGSHQSRVALSLASSTLAWHSLLECV